MGNQEIVGPDLIYENYKEPLKQIEKDKGYGYYGTIATTKDKLFIQCHICGELFASLGHHLRKHDTTADQYKQQFKLSKTTALVSDNQRKYLQLRVLNSKYTELPEHLVEYNQKVQSGQIVHRKKDGDSRWSLERRNREGLCPDQLLDVIQKLEEKLGHTPSYVEFRKEHGPKYRKSIEYIYGSYLNAVKKAGLVSAKELKEPSNERLLQDLVDFHQEHGRIPMTSDFTRGLLRPRAMYFRRFGSLNNARTEAGLNAVVAMPFGQLKEITPSEYVAYKSRHKDNRYRF